MSERFRFRDLEEGDPFRPGWRRYRARVLGGSFLPIPTLAALGAVAVFLREALGVWEKFATEIRENIPDASDAAARFLDGVLSELVVLISVTGAASLVAITVSLIVILNAPCPRCARPFVWRPNAGTWLVILFAGTVAGIVAHMAWPDAMGPVGPFFDAMLAFGGALLAITAALLTAQIRARGEFDLSRTNPGCVHCGLPQWAPEDPALAEEQDEGSMPGETE